MLRVAKGPQDLLPQEEALKLSGLEFMQKILDGTNPGPPIGHTMGYKLYEISEGRAVFRGAPEFNVTNPLGTVHGGWYGTLLDFSDGLRRPDQNSAWVDLHNAGIQDQHSARYSVGHPDRMCWGHRPRRSLNRCRTWRNTRCRRRQTLCHGFHNLHRHADREITRLFADRKLSLELPVRSGGSSPTPCDTRAIAYSAAIA